MTPLQILSGTWFHYPAHNPTTGHGVIIWELRHKGELIAKMKPSCIRKENC